MISLSLGSRLTVQGRKVRMSLDVRTGVRDDRKTSKLRTSPSISSRGSTSLVVGMFFDTLRGEEEEDDDEEEEEEEETVTSDCFWRVRSVGHQLIMSATSDLS